MKTEAHELFKTHECVYVISDIHSNMPALEAVLNQIPISAPIVCAGDVLGYYLDPNEVCELLQSRSVICIQGNHDKYVLGSLEYPVGREDKYRIIRTRDVLTDANRNWLSNLPDALYIGGLTKEACDVSKPVMLVRHGSLTDVEEYIYPDTKIEFLQEDNTSFIVLGHTHHPMLRKHGNTMLVNPGSVGQPRDRKPGASYASIQPLSRRVTFYRASYPIDKYQNRLKAAGITIDMINILSRSS